MVTDDIIIRIEQPEDYPDVYRVNFTAFKREEEPRLVENLRQSPDFITELSIIAMIGNRVVGHILFTPVTIEDGSSAFRALALAPVAVMPEHQNRGIGSLLVKQGLEESRRLGFGIVIVVGHPEYYPRFGFIPAREKGIDAPFDVPDDAFMVIELVEGALDNVSGMVKYPLVFHDVT